MTKPSILLRIAAAVSLLFALGHTEGGLKQWSPMGPNPVLKTMTDTNFQVMGASRSYLDFYMGFGWSLAVAGLLQTALLWQMANIARSGNVASVRPMVAAFAMASLASGLIAWRLLFPIPALFCIALFVPLAAACFAVE